MSSAYCTCRDCRRAKRGGKVLGVRLLKHLGERAHFVSDYVSNHRWRKGKRLDRNAPKLPIE